MCTKDQNEKTQNESQERERILNYGYISTSLADLNTTRSLIKTLDCSQNECCYVI